MELSISDRCPQGVDHIESGFTVRRKFHKVVELCIQKGSSAVLYARAKILKSVASASTQGSGFFFSEGRLARFRITDFQNVYDKEKQKQSFSKMLMSDDWIKSNDRGEKIF